MLDLAINGGTLRITDDNKTIVSENIADEIVKTIEDTDDKKHKIPELTTIKYKR